MESLFAHFAEFCDGVVVVDREARVVWMNEHYPRKLGLRDGGSAIGRCVEEVIPNSLMREVVRTGKPIMLDLMDFGAETFVVTRIPLHDEAGEIIGAVGLLLMDDARQLAPIVSRFKQMQADLAETRRSLAEARRTKYTLSSFIGVSTACQELKRLARRAARVAAPVLIVGETGTGKELLAQGIHAASPRADQPFVAVNVAAIPETLLEAEFFGVAAGAYTGADRHGREGKFKLADGGTLFLDEIADMSPALQSKLLRALQEGEIEPVGSNRLQAVDVRVIAATSRSLAQLVADGRFRADLYYRLNVITLEVPPLRERPGDLLPIGEHLLERFCRRLGMPAPELAPAALERLRGHAWPGNVRELANVLERALLTVEGDTIDADDLRGLLPAASAATSPAAAATLADQIAVAERSAIQHALRQCAGNKAQTAKLLGISRASLYEKLAGLGLHTGAAPD